MFRLAVCLFLILLAPASADEPLRLVTGDGYPPFTDQTLPDGGLATAIVREVFERAGFDVQIDWLPWREGYERSLTGEYAGAFPYVRTHERLRANLFSDPIVDARVLIVSSADRPIAFTSIIDLHDRTQCLPTGFANYEEFADALADGAILTVSPPSATACLSLIARGRADFMALLEETIPPTIEASGLDAGRFFVAAQELRRNPHYFIVSRGRPDARRIMAIFNQGLKALRADRLAATAPQ